MNRRSLIQGSAGILATILCGDRCWSQPSRVDRPNRTPEIASRDKDWLKAYVGKSVSAFLTDYQVVSFLSERVSYLQLEESPGRKWIDAIRRFTSKPDTVSIYKDRFIIATGCMAHCGLKRALIWIDTRSTQEESSLVPVDVAIAVIDIRGNEKRAAILCDGGVKTLPPNFRRTIFRWFRRYQSAQLWDGGRVNQVDLLTSLRYEKDIAPEILGIASDRISHSRFLSCSEARIG